MKKVIDLLTGKEVEKTFKAPKILNGNPVYESSPLASLGIVISNFEVKQFNYSPKVKIQIATQQEALMAVETAIAVKKKAEQEEQTKIAEGKANVAEARYKEEEIKTRAIVAAQKEKETAILKAEQNRDTAKLDKDAAVFYKEEQRLRGEGEAARKKAVMLADGALDKKLKALVEMNLNYAVNFGKQKWTPEIDMSGSSGKKSNKAVDLIDLLMVKTAKDLNLDMSIKTK